MSGEVFPVGEVLLRQDIVRPVVEVLVLPHIVEVLLRQHFVLYVSEALGLPFGASR